MSITFYFESPDTTREINMCNGNAAIMLAALGIPFDHCGAMDGRDFNRRAWNAYIKDDLELGRLVRPASQDGIVYTQGLDITGIRDRLFKLAAEGIVTTVRWG